MKNAFAPAFFLLLLASPFFSEERLSPEHRRWLEDVTPILTKAERETFLKLTSEEGRNRFIQFFWRQRDPLPDTSENEFYEEYMKRIRFADAQFGRETSKRGSQTERGYFYLLLGPPLERQIFTTSSQIVPLELWYYKGDVRFGLPPYFYLIFYQPQGLGEYRLYYPGMEGPERLVIPSYFRPTLSRTEAFGILKDVSAELANASLSYLPGERTFGVTTSSSATIIANAKSLAEKKFSDAYARSFLLFKDYVETDYSHDFIQNDFKVRVFKNFHQFFVHWTMEPKTVNFALHDDRYYARFELVLRMEDLEGRPVLEKVEEIPLEITPEQYEAHERRPFAFQDVLPVIPGSYRLFFLMKNKTARDFTSFQADILVPDPKKGPMMSPVLLCSRRERGGSPPGGLKAFAFEGTQYLVSAQNMFSSQDKLFLYGQVYNLQEIPEKNVLVEIFSSGAEAPATRLIKPLKDVLSPGGGGFEIGP
ncbi:MAG: GWxTD domain-containing protein, partial [Candidatus Aminicenantales bacterium]